MPLTRKIITAACGLALMFGACSPKSGNDSLAPIDVAQGRNQDWRELDADLARNATMSALRQHYPVDYQAFVDGLMDNYAKDIAENPERNFGDHRAEAMDRTTEFVSTMIKREKVYAVNAPPERLQQWVRSYADVLRAIKEQRGDQLCADYVSRGGEALPQDTSFMSRQWGAMNAALVYAMAEGRAKVKERYPATQEDFDAMTRWAIESGVDATLVSDMQAGRRSDPASVCDFMIGMNGALAEMPGEEGDRMRLKIMLDILSLLQGEVTIIRN